MDPAEQARRDFESGRGAVGDTHAYHAEFNRLTQRRADMMNPPPPVTDPVPLTPLGALLTCLIVFGAYVAYQVSTGAGPAALMPLVMIGSLLILAAAAYLVPFVTVSLTRGMTGLRGDAARTARWNGFVVTGIALVVSRVAAPGLAILAAIVAVVILARMLAKLTEMRAAIILAIATVTGVALIGWVGSWLLFGVLIRPFFG